jgi:WYL domain
MLEEITQRLWQASESRKVCRIHLKGEPLTRTIHPYGICRTRPNHIVLVCWQVLGFTKAGAKEGFRNLLLDNMDEVEMLEERFQVHPQFNALDGQYKEWVYHI